MYCKDCGQPIRDNDVTEEFMGEIYHKQCPDSVEAREDHRFRKGVRKRYGMQESGRSCKLIHSLGR
jgi:hypothetical protein